ncbi:hypothetical protein [Paenibacillus polymyxa]|uniref:hypothetical protein n=1 Tax=Paenibacillus polymyxa TaxID=1406 RepID=UPI000589C55D|nr:hypothetical protein [Paenibacillus polymyxa]AJE54224.1 hypothetical protein RE92_24855 [Paenibacillus polymyxa]
MEMEIEHRKLGFIKLEGFVAHKDISERKMKYCFICVGQYGGRQGDELARLGYSVFAINTSDSDLADLKQIPEERIIKLEGFEGAAKDIKRGQDAIRQNRDQIIDITNHPDVLEADHVFVIGGMGGGTGNVATPMICAALAKVRKPFNGKPSFGAIISVPASWEKRGIKKNARWGLAHLQDLVNKEVIGAILVVDNDKLYNLTQSVFSDTNTSLTWMDYGNSELTSLLAEVSILTSIPSSKTFDLDEWRDVLSTPGYLSLGKITIQTSEEIENKKIFKEAFTNSPTASDYDYDLDSVNGFMAVVHPRNEIITDSSFKQLEEQFGEFVENAEKPHSGLIENSNWGMVTSRTRKPSEDKKKAIIYTGAVSTNLPERISRMLVEITEEEEKLEKKKAERGDKNMLDLSSFKKVEEKTVRKDTSLDSELDILSGKKDTKNIIEDFDEDLIF